ncbi:hypothetical protein SMB34_19225 [Thalassospira permensis NBRC 106175]|jgi:hypothetical protein|uniref:Uncharacterized protein n=1 Tax=Thalassospira permensis NBRC 106175 TaxID=1353532 RepID=A0ABR4TMR6_9PROT|nr:hypothetical protein SMB34_19225 [Thalassospira permensis NBRC 106175]
MDAWDKPHDFRAVFCFRGDQIEIAGNHGPSPALSCMNGVT